MRIANKKRFIISCVFFTLVLSIFGKMSIFLQRDGTSFPIVMAVDKNKEENSNNNKNYTIVLDPGHGGVDLGTSYKNFNEKDLTLKIVKYAEEYLKDEGYAVVLTRNEDKLVPLKEIGNIANNSNADVFVSVHINSLQDINYKGITGYYYDGKGYETDERIKLVKTIGDEILKSDSWEDKGVKRENFAVLRYTKMPSALIECGFITNEEDRARLSKDEVLKRLAENISKGIINYLDHQVKNGYNKNSEDYTKLMVDEKSMK
ncbi:N-acetylmuramoyl-L-alanine amidase family protein [Clostridium magnum]|uniref:Sporulation-specific N-acetylmuramoyl-L-alanine amidase n=1 Tax=Clostridium magnum DSM 2767 TaxID=1121326 RepID=A0A161X7N4_9CLOT|nr:N-acetylmuramoyl-L-alanine amidase [Clostridium magnum]KZL90146.1 sporulation-specific N-acetylmuramoyl-L-alanine amidase [Clostridium magnum DSM 2767]SHH62292.1 N-acetylmuramoyl-L-alanine amidase [Clostridium magnum DSM 2767]